MIVRLLVQQCCVLSLHYLRIAGRDIGGGDPENMSPPNVEKYILDLFKSSNSSFKVEVVSDLPTIEKEYPLFAAVNRCASGTRV